MNFQQFSESHILTILPLIIGIWVVVVFIVIGSVRNAADIFWLGAIGLILTALALLVTPSEKPQVPQPTEQVTQITEETVEPQEPSEPREYSSNVPFPSQP